MQRGNDDGDLDTGSGGSSATTGGSRTGMAGRATGTAGTVGKMLPPEGGTGAGGATQALPTCTGGKLDPTTGLVRCIEGYSHRVRKVACVGSAGAPADASAGASSGGAGGDEDPPAKPRADGSVACGNYNVGGYSSVEDCSEFELGYCASSDFQSVCESGCVVDEDCGAGAICECGNPESPSGGICIDAHDCSTDTDCQPGYFCATYGDGGGCGFHAFACMTAQDECWSNNDCEDGGYCDMFGEHRACNDAVCGRPFLIDCTARVAPVVASGDWQARAAAPRVDHLTPSERDALARHWSRLGQLEHASIAAFARFSLQLLSLGAPPELVEQCTQALADETAHTKLCFQLASAYAGRALGPGKLDIDGSLSFSSLEDVVDLVIAEGCFGESGAALEALEAADAASDPVIRAAYTLIAGDEQRHAELAFRFVRWALEQSPQTVRERISSAVAAPGTHPASARAVALPCLLALLQATLPAPAAAGAPEALPVI